MIETNKRYDKKILKSLKIIDRTPSEKLEKSGMGICQLTARQGWLESLWCNDSGPFAIYRSNLLVELFKEWPQSSGSWTYPVPHPTMTPNEAFNSCKPWDNSEYGQNRFALLQFLINKMEQRINGK